MDTFSFFRSGIISRFDPTFDDRVFSLCVLNLPILTIRESSELSYVVTKINTRQFPIFDADYIFENDFEISILKDSEKTLWMSDTPQERMMMNANARHAKGVTLVGGLGLGIYPQYAQRGSTGNAERLVIVEKDLDVIKLVEPVMKEALRIPFLIVNDSIENYLYRTKEKFDEIFIDTWDKLEPRILPEVNRLKQLSLLHLKWGGMIHLWGYRWIMDLYCDACLRLMQLEIDKRNIVLQNIENVDMKSALILEEIESRYHGYSELNKEKIRKEIVDIGQKII